VLWCSLTTFPRFVSVYVHVVVSDRSGDGLHIQVLVFLSPAIDKDVHLLIC
jgi:hypothetical protein